MADIIETVDNIDNTGTLYEDVLSQIYSGDELNNMLTNTKFLRINILKIIKDFVEHEKSILIKEFSDNPIMSYNDSANFNVKFAELSTDLVIIKNATSLEIINAENQSIPEKYPLVLEALNYTNIKKDSWDVFLDTIYTTFNKTESFIDDKVHKIIIEDIITLFKNWSNTDDTITKEMIKAYNLSQGINEYNKDTFFQEPLHFISKNYWEKFSFVLTINDYDIYNQDNEHFLNIIAEKYFNNGYFDEVVIKINYFYWFDDFQKLVDWSEQNLKSALVSYRFDTIFNNTKNRYYNIAEATKYNDIQRKNTILEEMEMFETRLPIFLNKILSNPQTYGFELNNGYFGKEGNIPNLSINSSEFNEYKDIICKIMSESPLADTNDSFVQVFREPEKKIFACIKKSDGTTESEITL